jgi:GMP synthase (glutamine-hydrolysing)
MDRDRTKQALIVRHVPREGLAGYKAPLEAAGYAIERLDVCDPAFHAADFLSPDLVVLMGGPMGVYERSQHPWIAHEIERIAERLEYGLPTLGVCFGAQLIAAALGSDVYAGAVKEIGFAPLNLTGAGRSTAVAHLDRVPVLHWHGDTFDLPKGTELLASTGAYAHQGFRRGRNLLALQFHAEMGVDARIGDWIAESHINLERIGLTPDELRVLYATHGPRAVEAGQRMIGAWLEQLDCGSALPWMGGGGHLVELSGIEPLTSSLRTTRSPN